MGALAIAIPREVGEEFPWPDYIEELSKLWLEGKSGRQIADLLKVAANRQITRCAVLGKVRRLGLARRKPTEPQAVLEARAERSPAPLKLVPSAPMRLLALAAPPPGPETDVGARAMQRALEDTLTTAPVFLVGKGRPGVPLANLKRGLCRWPLEELSPSMAPADRAQAQRFCGAKCASGKSWCPTHHAMGWRPVQTAAARRRAKRRSA